MNGKSYPMLFEIISVQVCHGPSCPISLGTDYCPLQVRPQYGSVLIKASAHSFKRFTSRPFLKQKHIFLSLCTYYFRWMSYWISFERCQSSWEETEQGNITKNLVHRRIRTLNTARPSYFCNHSATPTLQVKELNSMLYVFICTCLTIRSINNLNRYMCICIDMVCIW